ncbi:hypothetical protein Ddye_020658 [Dipteronia dyeriana]|uniref:C2H2-type domain-containing protein n=1 Tax=Dipteronia dyeriana TaxID=168575 RepID=A0AAD9U0K9_9ROSI|nr:hypothetical protein Ddye_020656 [Dipteronia dyeriana]KAK2645463.1 hypothetical protein Ddye_020658 [Dipteronia dyeriana]
MEYLCHRQSSHDFDTKRRGCFRDLPPQKRMKTTTQFHSVNSGISPMTNHAPMFSLGYKNGYTSYTISAQQYQAAAMNPVRLYPPCMPIHVSNGAFPVPCMPSHVSNGALPVPVQPPVFPPPSSYATPNQQVVASATSHSDLISSLLSKGFISLPNQLPSQSDTINSLLNNLISAAKEESSAQDSIGLEFDPAKLKIRNESAIRALYADLPRQCTTCGMRFKIQEDHRQHMDWHVRKNRVALVAKSKRPKQMQSRKFFLTSDLWLTAAKDVGTIEGPVFFITGDVKDEKKKPEEAVFAEEDQKACPLCMEPFDEYFSNETNDWMYRGTACFKAAKDSDRKLHTSLEGRIVHAKCMQ